MDVKFDMKKNKIKWWWMKLKKNLINERIEKYQKNKD
jgi:hypothetical protein